ATGGSRWHRGRPGYADYLYWFHFANGTLPPAMVRAMLLRRAELPEGQPVLAAAQDWLALALGAPEGRLGASNYLAGPELTAADIMTVFSLSTMRNFPPFDLAPIQPSKPISTHRRAAGLPPSDGQG